MHSSPQALQSRWQTRPLVTGSPRHHFLNNRCPEVSCGNQGASRALSGACARYFGSVSRHLRSTCRHKPEYWTMWYIQDGDHKARGVSWERLMGMETREKRA